MKKSALVLSLVVLMTMFTFAGCGEKDTNNNGMQENGTTIEENNDGIIDETEKGVKDLGDDIEQGAEDIVDDTEDVLDGNDRKPSDNKDSGDMKSGENNTEKNN